MPDGRFAPSPTGDLHLGNLRTAILAWLWSRHDGSRFVVRMEDLDRVTSSPAHEARQLDDLRRIGLDWDGPVVRQSERFDLYGAAIDRLVADDLAYPCYCTRREIADAVRAPHVPPGSGYPGTCRDLTAAQRSEREAAGRPPAMRVRAPEEEIGFDDLILGPIARRPDDLVLRRNDGVPAYNLAVVVDDADQGLDIVVRADDLVDVTPGQILLQRVLGLPTPQYAHVPLVVNGLGARLAKRDGAVTLADRIGAGDEPAAVTAWLLRSCGHAPATTPADAVAAFDPTRIPRAPVTLDEATLSGDPGIGSLPSPP